MQKPLVRSTSTTKSPTEARRLKGTTGTLSSDRADYNGADKEALTGGSMTRKRKKLRGTVAKVIKSPHPSLPEKAEIDIHDADDLYREIRFDNELTDDAGEKASLKPGAKVDVIVEADSDATQKKPSASDKSDRKC